MKIIDLLNKIAKGEEVPTKIIYTDEDLCRYVFELELDKDYWCEELGNWLFDNWDVQKILNDEVEILEEVEDKEYKDIEEIKIYELEDITTLEFKQKINALIRNQKKIIERLDK